MFVSITLKFSCYRKTAKQCVAAHYCGWTFFHIGFGSDVLSAMRKGFSVKALELVFNIPSLTTVADHLELLFSVANTTSTSQASLFLQQ